MTVTRPNMLVKDFEKLFGNGSYFQPLKMNWDGYAVTEEDFYVHRGDIWREHRAQLNREERVKGLLRLWRFDKLPVGLNEPGGRRLIADREVKTVAYLGDQGSWMAERGILREVGTPPDEVLTEHHQLLSVPPGWTTLRRYIERNGEELLGEQRIDIVHTLASMIGELHSKGVAHRDIGSDAIWLGSPTNIALTGFFSATLPDDQSVSNFLEVLGTYSEPEPKWDSVAPTGKERDVHSLGVLMRRLTDLGGDIAAFPSGWTEVAGNALKPPGERYLDAQAFTDAIGELRSPSGPTVDQSQLDGYQTTTIPYVSYPPSGAPVNGTHCVRYDSFSNDTKVVVKVWNGILRGDARRDHSLLAMFECAASLKAVPLPGIAPVLDSGLSPVGPFVVTSWIDGATLSTYKPADEAALLSVLASLSTVVDALHASGFAHGDLHPDNVLVINNTIVLIDLIDVSPVGEGRVRSPAWAPQDHERRTDQQIDRFAVCRMVVYCIDRASMPSLSVLAEAASIELDRHSIETLNPLTEAIERQRRQLNAPSALAFTVSSPDLRAVSLVTDEGHVWIKAYRNADGIEVYWITGLNARILLRMGPDEIDGIELLDARLADLGQGIRLPMQISVERGPLGGWRELGGHLRSIVIIPDGIISGLSEELPDWEGEKDDEKDENEEETDPEIEVGIARLKDQRLDISRMWLRSAEIEEDTVLQVRLDRRLADAGNSAVYEYETPQPLEFEDEDIVEVRQGGIQGRRIGHLDVSGCDSRRLAIRDQRFPITEGDTVALIDRRDRVSKERRRRAVERITRRSGVIPGLIDYFDSAVVAPSIKYDLRVSEARLEAYKLNEGQRVAFHALLQSGPVGMLQGPPGSGKTKFIASFAHWLLTEGGARRVLIASQSHEAVNNGLEEVLKTYRAHGGHADLLRVGSRGATERVRPYQARSLRERYRLRFQNGLKTRVAHAAGAAGIPRTFVHDIVDVDQRLGSIQRTIELALLALESNVAQEEHRRSEGRLRTLTKAFSREASRILDRTIEVDVDGISAALEEVYSATLVRHAKVSPGDLVIVRRLIALAKEWNDTLVSGRRNFDEFLAKTRRVVAGTCVGLGQSQIRLEEGTFDWVIVDEAARCTSGELAVPLQLGRRVVLVGDQRQLRPMVDRAVQEGLRDEFKGHWNLLARSDFERAFESPYGKKNALVLDEQYRMTPVISNLVSDTFYAPHGVSLTPSKDRIADVAFEKLSGVLATPLVWLDTSELADSDEKTRNDGKDIWNDAEVSAVISLLHRFSREHDLTQELYNRNDPSIGVICMYSEQKRRIEREWSQQPFSEAFRKIVTIDTVDAYQGKENSIVIVTLVRTNDDKLPGHVGRENRCNVALSRAKERLYIVGNVKMWSSSKCHSPMRSVLTKIKNMSDQDGRICSEKEIRK
ncbi:AAA domain-containing protein [Rhodopseudomonas sp. P2A-2r]|uniref:AAA domain-containing protein n=1 Tax=Rhodopseudomonas sp. P2A-2r TaxID=2991972 RepID=UPI002234DD75|nr:AAA domain-containing protein [Rhodopseudomonas sp. P2A-2r]UZE50983.1 AAA domain-containing protein [Rhodopseudomonas sp. P2A-2r]